MNRRVESYDLVQLTTDMDDGLNTFTEMVNQRIRVGWEPIGSVQAQMVIAEPSGLIGKTLGSSKPLLFLWQSVVRYEADENQYRKGKFEQIDEKLSDIVLSLEKIEDRLSDIISIADDKF